MLFLKCVIKMNQLPMTDENFEVFPRPLNAPKAHHFCLHLSLSIFDLKSLEVDDIRCRVVVPNPSYFPVSQR